MLASQVRCIAGMALLTGILSAPADADSVSELLSKTAKATETVSYKGTYMYSRGFETETMQVYHRVEPDGFKARILSLNGDESEIIRSEKGVWCYFPDRKEGFFKARDKDFFRLPDISAESIPELKKYYLITLDGEDRIADRTAYRLKFEPRDSYRYGANIWIDEESGLPLRSDLLNQDLEIIDKYMFVEITVNEQIHESDLMPSASGDDYVWNFSAANNVWVSDEASSLTVSMIPDGFKKIKHVRSQLESGEKEQMVFSDDLATVSLFSQKLDQIEVNGIFTGSSQLGSVNAYGRVVEGYQITVLGEVPVDTVIAIGDSVSVKSSE